MNTRILPVLVSSGLIGCLLLVASADSQQVPNEAALQVPDSASQNQQILETVAAQTQAILALSRDVEDLQRRVSVLESQVAPNE